MLRLAFALGLSASADSAFERILGLVLDLRERLEIPPTFAAIGIDERQADRIAMLAANDPTASTNPRPVDAAQMRALFTRCVSGARDGW